MLRKGEDQVPWTIPGGDGIYVLGFEAKEETIKRGGTLESFPGRQMESIKDPEISRGEGWEMWQEQVPVPEMPSFAWTLPNGLGFMVTSSEALPGPPVSTSVVHLKTPQHVSAMSWVCHVGPAMPQGLLAFQSRMQSTGRGVRGGNPVVCLDQ